jgi:2,3-bisphosphoglycerate-dependent phosphoglycerate mutase
MAFHKLFTSVLKRAIDTANLALEEAKIKDLPVERDAALNERHYGDLQGLNKDETRAKFGAEQVFIWRRSFDVSPPGGESLKDTCARAIPYFENKILPLVKAGKNVLVVAHGNSLRGLVKDLEDLSDEEITKVEIPTGVPIVYDLDGNGRILQKKILE